MKKIKLHLILMVIISLVIMSLVIMALIFLLTSRAEISLILVIVAIGLAFLLFKIKTEFDYLRHTLIIEELLKNKAGIKKIKYKLLNDNFYNDKLTKLNYVLHHRTSEYDLYYKVDKGISPGKNNQILYAILIVDEGISFIDKKTSDAFQKLEQALPKNVRYNKRIFYQFKKTSNAFTENDISDADKIFFLSMNHVNVVVLNVLYNDNTNSLYYLNANKIKLPYLLKIAYDELIKVIGKD